MLSHFNKILTMLSILYQCLFLKLLLLLFPGIFFMSVWKKYGEKIQFKNIEYLCYFFLYFFHNLPFNSLSCRNMAYLSIQDIQLRLITRVFILCMNHCMKLGNVCGMLELPALKNILILGQPD